MTPFKPATVPHTELEVFVESALKQWIEGVPEIRQSVPNAKTEDEARIHLTLICNQEAGREVFLNDLYQVSVRRTEGTGVHLSIKRRDRQPIHDWRDLQEIKNQLVGSECEAVELYPAESRRVDTSNQYHLWCIDTPEFRFPFGFSERMVTDRPVAKSVNRPL